MSDSNEPKGRAKGGLARAKKLSGERMSEIAKKAALARWQNPRGKNPSDLKVLVRPGVSNPRSPMQAELDLQIQKQVEIDGIGMGVLSDGTAFLNGRGLARLCGIDSSRISEMGADWQTENLPLTASVKAILVTRGVSLAPYLTLGSNFMIVFR